MADKDSTFPIPASLHDLERAPYNLLPYPSDFEDDDEAARADSFEGLVNLLEQGNRSLASGGIWLFMPDQENDELWMDECRVQALYTLVRKSTSLGPNTRSRLVESLCKSVKILSSILDSHEEGENGNTIAESSSESQLPSQSVMSQSFRDAFACHLYMLFSVMFFTESEAKVGNTIKSAGSRRGEKNSEHDETVARRATCAEAMLAAAKSMGKNRSRLWRRGVPDESVVVLPCRIAYQMLESATGVVARKAASADVALGMIAATVDSAADILLGTVVAALMDLMHSYEHMAPLCAELCCMVSENPTNPLAVELIREVGRLDIHGVPEGNTGSKASGVKNVVPFISELATARPRLVLANMSHLLPLLNSEMYTVRSAIVNAVSHIIKFIDNRENRKENSSQEDSADDEYHARLNLSKSRESLLDLLAERILDVNSFTRATVLKAWINLIQCGSIPVQRFIRVAALAIDRLQDKTVVVRKQAMHLLTVVLENNPFMGNLDPELYREKLAELYNFVKSNMPSNIEEARNSALMASEETKDARTIRQIEEASLAAAIAEADSMDESEELSEGQQEFRSKVQALKFTQSALDFIELFHNARDAFEGMLLSSNSSDVTEALRFFVRARHFNLPCAVTGMKQALTLMWSTEQNIQDEVRKAFIDVFIAEPGSDGEETLPHDQIAKNLVLLVEEASLSELASIEEAIVCLVRDEKIPADVFFILWSVASKGPRNARAAAMNVISMGARADRNIVDSKSRLKLLLDTGLGEYTEAHKDWRLARAASMALQGIGRTQVDPACARYLVLERIMEQLCVVARGDWCVDEDKNDTLEWFSASEQAIKALFVISPCPESDCSDIIRGMHAPIFHKGDSSSCHTLRLARFFHVLGHIALHLLVYTESLSSSVRRANAKKTLAKQEEAGKKNAKSTSDDSTDEDEAIEAELGLAAEVEAENERKLTEISEKEILSRGIISIYLPLLVRIVGNEGGKFRSEILMQASMLTLCKFMCVSSSFCEKHLPLLFNSLSKAPAKDTAMRANTVVALGDLAFRFPNEFEPYTPHLYACLRDSSTKVRRHTLMVLTHLILNDMVKVKGQVCEIAVCLQDQDGRIRDMAGLLFHELSKRSNNPIYNLLPDIISQLSQLKICKDDFRSILGFLLGYIKTEKQSTMLTEKLCGRFPKASSISDKADIAYCISQLKTSEKSVKCVIDNFKLYKDSLYDADVKKCFLTVLSRAKKFSKPELKDLLDEFEKKLNEHAEIGMQNELAREKAEQAKSLATRRGATNTKVVKEQDDGSNKELDLRKESGDKENMICDNQTNTRRSKRVRNKQ